LEQSAVRILVVEDFSPYRTFIRSLLGGNGHFEVVGEAADGLEAVRIAQELVPEVILMDIGLPKLNGLDAARRIRKLLPSSKIVFLTQEAGEEVIEEAFRIGASGYIQKDQAGADLLRAIRTALGNGKFLRRGLAAGEPAAATSPIQDKQSS
jgi:DNA-binding NarL/FixJ family response regulator